MEVAETHFTAGLAHYADTNDVGGVATAEEGLGQVAFRRRDCERAAQHYRQALQLAAASSYVPRIMSLLNRTGELLLSCGDRPRASRLLAFLLASPNSGHDVKEEATRLLAQWAEDTGTADPPGQITLDEAVTLAEAALDHAWH